MENPIYLGDGVYAEYDGYGIWLKTGDHREAFCDNKIYLEDMVLASLNNFVRRIEAENKKKKGE